MRVTVTIAAQRGGEPIEVAITEQPDAVLAFYVPPVNRLPKAEFQVDRHELAALLEYLTDREAPPDTLPVPGQTTLEEQLAEVGSG